MFHIVFLRYHIVFLPLENNEFLNTFRAEQILERFLETSLGTSLRNVSHRKLMLPHPF